MTGFARGDGQASFGTFFVEVKSVNGKGFDARLNLPRDFVTLENAIKNQLKGRFSRGSFQLSLKYSVNEGDAPVKVNEAALRALIEAYEKADGQLATGQVLATLMTARGVLEETSGEIVVTKTDESVILDVVDTALSRLAAARSEEGAQLADILKRQIDEISSLTVEAHEFADDQLGQIRTRFETRLQEIDVEDRVDPERLAAEVAVLVAKADVTEELDRLEAHVLSARALLEKDEPIGRNLGFLAQEFHREANTLCSKSASLGLTNAGLALKSLIDQLKEQSANVE
ncbi:MAG: YicC/YloC family endoribonuclease [Pseudomonadota bacterium]